MRLIDTRTGRFRSVEDPGKVHYAILSHVWTKDGDGNPLELSYQDVRKIEDSIGTDEPLLPHLSEKIQAFCETARKSGFDLAWVDSCCIDKTSISELPEAINSMFNWYRSAAVCIVFLHDVDPGTDEQKLYASFGKSKWFRRGWTLQELLAPSVVLFLSSKWTVIGSKGTLAPLIEDATGIDQNVLTLRLSLDNVSIARRMSWAASRETTREEDEAYSLMGIFGVNMPTAYGEGRYAFIRLQEEIIKHNTDQTIFAWGTMLPDESARKMSVCAPSRVTHLSSRHPSRLLINQQYLLASSPKDFKNSSGLRCVSPRVFAYKLQLPTGVPYQLYMTTPYGIKTSFPLVAVLPSDDPRTTHPTHLAILACEDEKGHYPTLLLRPQGEIPGRGYFVGAIVGCVQDILGAEGSYNHVPVYLSDTYYYRITYITPNVFRGSAAMTNVFIPHQPSHVIYATERDASKWHASLRENQDTYEVQIPQWSQDLLAFHGYTISQGDDRLPDRSFSSSAASVLIRGWDTYIRIRIGRCSCHFGSKYPGRLGFLAVLVRAGSTADTPEDRPVAPHLMNDPAHVLSWPVLCGVALKQFDLPGSGVGDRLAVKLTLTHDSSASPPAGPNVYQLGVEIIDARPRLHPAVRTTVKDRKPTLVVHASAPELPDGARQKPAVGASSMQRSRSNSQPPPTAPLHFNTPLFDEPSGQAETATPQPMHPQPNRTVRDGSAAVLLPPLPPTTGSVGDSLGGSDVSEEGDSSSRSSSGGPASRGTPELSEVCEPAADSTDSLGWYWRDRSEVVSWFGMYLLLWSWLSYYYLWILVAFLCHYFVLPKGSDDSETVGGVGALGGQ